MSSNTSPPKTPVAGPVKKLHEGVKKETPKDTIHKRRERRKNKKVEAAETPIDITPSSSQTIVAQPASHENDLPISKRAIEAEEPTGITPSSSQPLPTPIDMVDPSASQGNDQSISEMAEGAEAPTGITSSSPQATPTPNNIVGPLAPVSGKAKESEAPPGITPTLSRSPILVAPPAIHQPESTPPIPPPTWITIVDLPASRGNQPISENIKGAVAPTGITPSTSQPLPTTTTVSDLPQLSGNDLPIPGKVKGADAPTGNTPSSSQPLKEGEKEKGRSQERREIDKYKKAVGAEASTGITPSSSQTPAPVPPAIHQPGSTPLIPPPTPTAIFDPTASHGNDGPISASAPVPPTSFAFGPITTVFGQSQSASLPLPPVIGPKSFAFGPATTTFTQAPPHPPHKTFTEVEVNLQLIAAKAEAGCKADQEISALSTKLEDSKKESYASKVELGTTRTELERARKELKRTRETLEGAEIQLDATKAGLDGIATNLERIKAELNSERTTRQVFEAELATTREALDASKKRWVALLLLLLALNVLLWSIYLLWSTWTGIQLPLAVVSRIDSAHMYPEMSEAWMTMDKFGWFGD